MRFEICLFFILMAFTALLMVGVSIICWPVTAAQQQDIQAWIDTGEIDRATVEHYALNGFTRGEYDLMKAEVEKNALVQKLYRE